MHGDCWLESLAVIVNFVVILSVLLGFCALGFEIGLLELKHLQLQRAADAAALGGAYAFERGSSAWASAAAADAALNGFTNGVDNVTVTAVDAPTSGLFFYDKSAVQATVSQQVSTMFHVGSFTLSAQATALLPPCLYLTSANTSVATYTISNSAVSMSCSAYVGYSISYSGSVNASVYAAYFWGPEGASNVGALPTLYYNYPQQPDPLASVTSPAYSSCTSTNTSIGSSGNSVTTTISPGTYCGGLTVTNSTVTLSPGLYIITGGMTLNKATLNGTGVTLFLTSSTGASGYGKFSATNSSTLNLSAATSSANNAVPGIVIFGDRNWSEASGPSSTSQDFTFTSSTLTGDGIIYLTNTGINCTGCTMGGTNYFAIVASNLSESSNANLNLSGNFSYLTGGNPFRPRESLAQ